MPAQPKPKSLQRNPRTLEEAEALVTYVESLFNPWNVDALVEGFTADCQVRFVDVAPFSGHEQLRELFGSRSKRQRNYRLTKTLRAMMNDTLAIMGEGTWEDVATGETMSGWGCEIWRLRDGKIAVWEGAFNVYASGGASASLLDKAASS